MKKLLLIILTAAILISCANITTTFAKTENRKITTALAEKIENLSHGEKVETCIWLVFKYDAELVARMTFDECGLTAGSCTTTEKADLYAKTYNRILGELEAAGNKALIEKIGVENEEIVFFGTISPLVVLKLTKEQIYTIADFKEVQFLDYDETILGDEPADSDLPTEPTLGPDPLETLLPDLAREYYNDNSISDENIKIEYRLSITSYISVVKFSVEGYEYSDTITETQVGEYILRSSEPQPLILHVENKKLYTFAEAYKQGVVDDAFLEDISRTFEVVGLTKKNTEPTMTDPAASSDVTEPSTATEPSSVTEPSTATEPTTDKPVVTSAKKANPMKVTVKTKTVKYSKVKKSKQTVAPITVKKAQGKVTYKKLSGSKKLLLKANGKIVVKKGTKKGTYTAKIKVTAKGNSKYKSASKTVTVKIKVK
ncbi:MAG: hypothetical protein IJ725_01355 [Ruminococcus sp.]|nr:hypothetical protein [Ruminococcus sp.]